MQAKTFEFQQRRAELFLGRLQGEFLICPRELTAVCAFSEEPVPVGEWGNLTYHPIRKGDNWGHNRAWSSGYFVLSGKMPMAESRGRVPAVRLNFCGELLVADMEERCRCGLTSYSVFETYCTREYHRIGDLVESDGSFSFRVEAAANHLSGIEIPFTQLPGVHSKLDFYETVIRHMEYGWFDEERFQLAMDVELLLNQVQMLQGRNIRVRRVMAALARAIDVYAENPENSSAARQELKEVLACHADASALQTTAVGHAHIDTGWMWPVRESIRKCARTYASQLELIGRYPEYIFGASAPQHFAFLKKHYPELYARVKAAVKAGRIEPQGGMWVEADTNLTSGESLIRQFVHGKNFFRDEFGVEVTNLWIPDVFGYSGALPQIIRKCRCDFFLTQKLSWNKYNTFPHNTFRWIGIDGSEVVTHFPPENTYNSRLLPETLVPAGDRFVENDFLTETMSLFGIGDGGGGPREEYIQAGLRQKDLEGSPRISFGTAESYFRQVLKKRDQLAGWHGELYFETHRGTYTTQALTKKMNRKNEYALTAVEMLWSMLPVQEYPQEALDRLWKTLLLNQFHDILPGSSIKLVYDVTKREHREIAETCEDLLRQAAERLFTPSADTAVAINLLSSPVERSFALPEGWLAAERADGEASLSGNGCMQTVIPPFSAVTIRKKEVAALDAVPVSGGTVLENELVRYEFNGNGELISAKDRRTGKEILAPGGRGNIFTLYVDMPNDYDAWDVDEFYRNRPFAHARLTAMDRVDSPVRQTLFCRYEIGSSVIEQEISLENGSKGLRFDTRVDWREEHKFLRTAFETAYTHVRDGIFDIQYGYLARPAYVNTSWDAARFETSAHRFADLSDQESGVALLNDCKYGYYVREGILDLALLRSPRSPDHTADMGEHEFTYLFLPHTGALADSEVQDRAAELNRPPLVFAGLSGDLPVPFRLSGEGVTLGAVKRAEKSEDLIIRLAEKSGRHSKAVLVFPQKVCIAACDMLEWEDLAPAETTDRQELEFTPFEIKTLRIKKLSRLLEKKRFSGKVS